MANKSLNIENKLSMTEEEKKIRIQRLLRGFDDGPIYHEDQYI